MFVWTDRSTTRIIKGRSTQGDRLSLSPFFYPNEPAVQRSLILPRRKIMPGGGENIFAARHEREDQVIFTILKFLTLYRGLNVAAQLGLLERAVPAAGTKPELCADVLIISTAIYPLETAPGRSHFTCPSLIRKFEPSVCRTVRAETSLHGCGAIPVHPVA